VLPVLTILTLCFPDHSEDQRNALLQEEIRSNYRDRWVLAWPWPLWRNVRWTGEHAND
jgi:lauroyl/myristoyl acyltransferase